MYRKAFFEVLLIAVLFIPSVICAQHKLVFRNGWHRVVVKPGKSIGITTKGKPYVFSSWITNCSPCLLASCVDSLKTIEGDTAWKHYELCLDTVCLDNIWTLDSVRQDYLVLRRLPADSADYRFDSIPAREINRYSRRMKKLQQEYYFSRSIPPPDSDFSNTTWVFAVPVNYDRLEIPYDSIAIYSFAREESCSGFGIEVPLFVLTAAIGAPIAASDKSYAHFNWPVFLVGEAFAGYITGSMVRYIRNLRVRQYDTNKWRVKPK